MRIIAPIDERGVATFYSPSADSVLCRIESPAEYPAAVVAFVRDSPGSRPETLHEIQRPGPDVIVSFPAHGAGVRTEVRCPGGAAKRSEGEEESGDSPGLSRGEVAITWR